MTEYPEFTTVKFGGVDRKIPFEASEGLWRKICDASQMVLHPAHTYVVVVPFRLIPTVLAIMKNQNGEKENMIVVHTHIGDFQCKVFSSPLNDAVIFAQDVSFPV